MRKDVCTLSENLESEFIVGSEDRVFADNSGKWYWQARGTRDCIGPFKTSKDAIRDYEKN